MTTTAQNTRADSVYSPILEPNLRLTLLHAQQLRNLLPPSGGWASVGSKEAFEMRKLLRSDS